VYNESNPFYSYLVYIAALAEISKAHVYQPKCRVLCTHVSISQCSHQHVALRKPGAATCSMWL